MKQLLLLLLLSMSALAQTMKSPPLGIYVVLPNNDSAIDGEACWKDKNVLGVLLRTNWSNVEVPGDGSTFSLNYDWSYFDHGVALAAQYNKKIMLSISAGVPSPSWIYSLGAVEWTCTYFGTMPPPWDQVFQQYFAACQQACGQRYDSNPVVVGVTITGLGHGVEAFFAQVQHPDIDNLNALGGAPIWLGGAEAVTDFYEAAWPTTYVSIATGINYAPDNGASMTEACQYGLGKYGAKFGLESHGLNPGYPGKGNQVFPHTTLSLGGLQFGYQAAAAATSADEVANELAAAELNGGVGLGALWVQLYPTDPPLNETACQAFNNHVGATLLAVRGNKAIARSQP